METRNIVVLIHHIHCVHSTKETTEDDVYEVIHMSNGNTETYDYENPHKMKGKNDKDDTELDIAINATYLDWIDVELREKDKHGETQSLGRFTIDRDSPNEDTVRLYQPSGKKAGIYDVSYRIIDKPIPTVRVFGIKCEKDSAGCDVDLVDTLLTVAEEVTDECADILKKSPRPSRKLMAKAFDHASKVIGRYGDVVKWMANALEGKDDIYLQHITPENSQIEGGMLFPDPKGSAKNYKMESGDVVYFEDVLPNQEYVRVALDKEDVTIQLREDDPHKADVSVGSFTIKQSMFDELKDKGAQVVLADEYFDGQRGGEGALYMLCFSVGIEDWSLDPNIEAQETGAGQIDEPPLEGVFYNLENRMSDKIINVPKGQSEDGSNVYQHYPQDLMDERWQIVPTGSYVYILNQYNGKALHVANGETDSKAPILISELKTGSNFYWKLEYDSDGYFKIKNVFNGKYLSATSSNDQLLQFEAGEIGIHWYNWRFVRTSKKVGTEGAIDAPPAEDLYYQIINVGSGHQLAIDKKKCDEKIDDNVTQTKVTPENYSNQRWRIIDHGNDIEIINEYSKTALRIDDENYSNNTDILLDEPHNSSWLTWKLLNANQGEFYLKSCYNDKVISVENESNADGANIVQYDQHAMDWPYQKWKFKATGRSIYSPGHKDKNPVEKVYYKIVNKNSNLALTVDENNTNFGDTVFLGANEENKLNRWHIIIKDDYYFHIVNQYTGKLIGVEKGANSVGDNVVLCDPKDKNNHWWNRGNARNGFLWLKNPESLLCLGAENGSTQIGATVVQTNSDASSFNNISWSFIRCKEEYIDGEEINSED